MKDEERSPTNDDQRAGTYYHEANNNNVRLKVAECEDLQITRVGGMSEGKKPRRCVDF